MKNIDVLMIYEHKNRELENCALLAAELERRGLTTKVFYNYTYPIRKNYEAKVIITPHLYNDWHLEFYTRNKKQNNRNAISLQYEHVITEGDEDGINNPTGQAMNAQHIAWGDDQVRRYLEHGIQISHIHKTGCVSMDFMRAEFKGFFLSKHEVAEKLGIDENKEWVLFISSFAFPAKTEEAAEPCFPDDKDAKEKAAFSIKSYNIIMEWLKAAANKYPDKLFIYRKHPKEKLSHEELALEKTLPNFKFISDFTMRQWAVICDKFYNWISTSQADIYFAHKSSFILRPVTIPREMDIPLFLDSENIKTKELFLESLEKGGFYSTVPPEKMQMYYSNQPNGKMAFEKIADLCEEMIGNPQMGCDYKFPRRGLLATFVKDLYDRCLYCYGKRFKAREKTINFFRKYKFSKTFAAKLEMLNQELYGAEELYETYHLRFQKLLETIHSNGQ